MKRLRVKTDRINKTDKINRVNRVNRVNIEKFF